ncbi:hypothetical protein C4J89_4481 [Pseudomonas sp. R4-35-07]|nr:hypothetical protein C4J89_4481 [Pseudomonas sp. R4-35-07]
MTDFSEKIVSPAKARASWDFPPLCYRCGITLKFLERIAA